MSGDEAWVEYLLRNVEARLQGNPLTDAEAKELHEFAFAAAWEREQQEEGDE